MKVSEAKRSVARTTGRHNSPDGLAIALESIQNTVREWNSRHDWEFKVTRLSDISVAADQQELTLPNVKKILVLKEHTEGNATGKTFRFQRYRDILSNSRNTSEPGLTNVYTVIPSDDPDQHTILFFQPFEAAGTIDAVVHRTITMPVADDENLNIPDEYLEAFIHGAKARFLGDTDSENPRLSYHAQMGEAGLRNAIRQDRNQPDEDFGLKASWETGRAYGDPDEEAYGL